MNDERPGRPRSNGDSQLSAMFDGELAAAECELLARRLSRDEALRAQWSRYALIGAALRAERGVILHERVAWRVQSVIAQEASYGDVAAPTRPQQPRARAGRLGRTASGQSGDVPRWMRFARPVVGAGIAAGVAAMSILWLRDQENPETLVAQAPVSESITLTPEPADITVAQNATPVPSAPTEIGGSGEPERYSTPAPSPQTSIAPPARFANYVVAHSEYSGPLARRMALLGIVSDEAQAEGSDQAEAVPAKPATGAADAR